MVRLDELTPAQRRLVLALIDAFNEADLREDRNELLSIPEAARRLGIGRTLAYHEVMTGRLPSIKVGRRRLIAESAITEYIGRKR